MPQTVEGYKNTNRSDRNLLGAAQQTSERVQLGHADLDIGCEAFHNKVNIGLGSCSNCRTHSTFGGLGVLYVAVVRLAVSFCLFFTDSFFSNMAYTTTVRRLHKL